jgi:hypothetical protein
MESDVVPLVCVFVCVLLCLCGCIIYKLFSSIRLNIINIRVLIRVLCFLSHHQLHQNHTCDSGTHTVHTG